MTRIKIGDDRWVRCGNCNHKLFRVLSLLDNNSLDIEIKCHSCRTINTSRETYYFTFGIGQAHARQYVKIEARNAGEAREMMINRFGTAWAFQYTEEEWNEFKAEGKAKETELCSIRA